LDPEAVIEQIRTLRLQIGDVTPLSRLTPRCCEKSPAVPRNQTMYRAEMVAMNSDGT